MKSAQWTAVLVLALMVGGISFISVYLGGGNRKGGAVPIESFASLTFPVKVFPREGENVQTTEVRQWGHQDFWFVNESGNDVTVGLNAKGCTCSEVEITVERASWRPYLVRSAVTTALEQPLRRLANLTTLVAANSREQLYPEMPDSEETSTMLTLENSKVVPADAVGRIRLSWQRETANRLNAYADLWTGQRGSSTNARLEVNVLIAAPMEVGQKDLTISALSERDLEKKPKGQRASILCFSVTRASFDVKAEMLHERLKPESDPIEVGDPIPVSAAKLPRLESDKEKTMLTALSAYRIPVTVRARAKDGTPIEWGHFRRVVQLSSSDASIEPIQVTVSGAVQGDVAVGEGKGGGAINLGAFPISRGAHGSILLQSDVKGMQLELDTSRKPEFLSATLSKPEETSSDHRLWVLRVEVRPDAASGEFPNVHNPVYRDSAIYVKTRVGNTQTPHRSIRIPVLGVAYAG